MNKEADDFADLFILKPLFASLSRSFFLFQPPIIIIIYQQGFFVMNFHFRFSSSGFSKKIDSAYFVVLVRKDYGVHSFMILVLFLFLFFLLHHLAPQFYPIRSFYPFCLISLRFALETIFFNASIKRRSKPFEKIYLFNLFLIFCKSSDLTKIYGFIAQRLFFIFHFQLSTIVRNVEI